MERVGLLVFMLLCCTVAGLMLLLNAVLGPRKPSSAKSRPFECGELQIQPPAGRLPVHFYLVGMLFILFDVELVWLFPWAVILREQGVLVFWEMLIFLGMVVVGFWYAWQKGALEWER